MRCKNVCLSLAFLSLAFVVGACGTDVETIFVERPFFDDPPATAVGFLGYGNTEAAAAKLTVCGNCHIGQQSMWQTTGHSDAWNTLQANPNAQGFCEDCHAVSERGNPAEGDVALTATADPRYYDVQCEACHGPGAGHVANPDASQPLAQLAVATDLEAGCGECHQGTHHGFVDEWAASPHAGVIGFAAAREGCEACHKGQATLEAWGEDAEYIEKDSAEPLAVVCGVCHDPHGSENEHDLRFPVNTTSIETHLCAKCHDRRTIPDPNSSHGLEPHSPESALLVGSAGWFPPGGVINEGEIAGTHGTEGNPKLCATCHLAAFEVTDPATGDHIFNVTGHTFRPIPCLDAQGIPEPFTTDCELTTAARSFGSCTEAGCHGSEQAAFSALTVATLRIQTANDDLLAQLTVVDPNLDDAGGEIDPADPTFTVAEGAFFNHALAEFGNESFGTNTVVGTAVHNPFLIEALLLGSQQAVFDEYGVAPRITTTEIEARLQQIKAESRAATR